MIKLLSFLYHTSKHKSNVLWEVLFDCVLWVFVHITKRILNVLLHVVSWLTFYNYQHYLQLIPVHIKCSHKTARLWHALNFKGATLSHTHSLRKIMYKSVSLHRCQEISSQTENQGTFFREHTCIASNYCHVKKSQCEFPTQEILNRSRIQRSDLKWCCWGLEPVPAVTVPHTVTKGSLMDYQHKKLQTHNYLNHCNLK